MKLTEIAEKLGPQSGVDVLAEAVDLLVDQGKASKAENVVFLAQ